MRLACGLGLVLLGLLAWLVSTHLQGLRFFDRPTLARNRLFDPLAALIRWLLILGGLGLIAQRSVGAMVAITLGLALLWGYRRAIHSASFQRRLLERDYEALRKERPGAPAQEILCQLVYRRHPAWGAELIELMVTDNPDIESLARMMARMERGFRGFRP
jgi:hypothetical protein